ncbi:MAG: feruloyl-CoA synthase [Pseudomonadota bacterium]
MPETEPIPENGNPLFAAPVVEVRRNSNGGMKLCSPQTLNPYPRHLLERLYGWAKETPDRTFIAERGSDGKWNRITYHQTLQIVRSISQALLDRQLTPQTPVAILSENSVDHALLLLGCMQIGVPPAPISPAYSLVSKDFEKLKAVFQALSPAVVFASDGKRFETALSVLDLKKAEIILSKNPISVMKATPFSDLTKTPDTSSVDDAFMRLAPESVAKILFTSGSTGIPKGVINTQRMICSNQQAILQVWPFLSERAPVIVDWLPWSHTFGGNQNFNMVLFNGGTLYIDDGKPVPGLIERTVENLIDIHPTLYFNVPRGFDALLPFLEKNDPLRKRFFKNLDLIFYAGAALPQHLWERLETLSIKTRGKKIPILSGWGATETAPMVTIGHFFSNRAGLIGLPGPGSTLKMVPNGDKLEMRIKGPNVTPGYWGNPELTRLAFDEEGFYCTGDAGRLVDPDHPEKGILFDGRVAEDFKLLTGTWVHAGILRLAVIAALSPVVSDVVITGHDADTIGALLFPNIDGCQTVFRKKIKARHPSDLIRLPELSEYVKIRIRAYNAQHPAGSTRISRLLFLSEPPDIDADEITDKGYINQRAVLTRRAEFVNRMYNAGPDDQDVIVP